MIHRRSMVPFVEADKARLCTAEDVGTGPLCKEPEPEPDMELESLGGTGDTKEQGMARKLCSYTLVGLELNMVPGLLG